MLINLGKGLGHWINVDLLPPNPIIVDGGACQGRFIDRIKTYRPNAIFIAVEPCRTNIDYLKTKYKRDKNVILHTGALMGDTSSPVKFTEYHGLVEWGNAFDLYTKSKRGRPEQYLVNPISLTDIVSPYQQIDYIKLDIEGAEWEVLKIHQNVFMESTTA